MIASTLQSVAHAAAEMPRRRRRMLLAIADFAILLVLVWALLSLRYWQLFWPETTATLLMALAGPVITVIIFLLMRVYHLVSRYLGWRGMTKLAGGVAIATLIWASLMLFFGQHGFPRSVLVMYFIAATALVVTIRLIASATLHSIGVNLRRRGDRSKLIPVLIYGTGDLSVRLFREIMQGGTRSVIGFVDGSLAMIGRSIDGRKIYRPERIEQLVFDRGVEEIIIAVDHQSPSERRHLLKSLEKHRLRVRIVPDLEEIAVGRIQLRDLRGVEGRDLLGRDEVPADPKLLSRSVTNKTVLITGAGGSIGSQLSRRVLRLAPARLVLLDHSEGALYEIESELRKAMATWDEDRIAVEIVPVLGSILNDAVIREALVANKVNTIFHAAAFKHVPIVEQQPLAGVVNNTLGTELLAREAMDFGVERFVLISTDKAVRPTSVMGASKRLAEMLLQALATETDRTIFTAVRFGNVLDSSGSVMRRFRDQIREGGPITVTDRDVVRYFMSLEEAADLVIQAAGLAEGGEVFVLDMGSPVKIDDLARSMVRLMGLEVRTEERPDGDIEILYTGLRPGEKLVEELVDNHKTACGTSHPRIMKSIEPTIEPDALYRELEHLRHATMARDEQLLISALMMIVSNYTPDPRSIASAAERRKSAIH